MASSFVVRLLAAVCVAGLTVAVAPPALAIDPPVIDPGALPPDSTAPEGPMRSTKECMAAFAREGSVFVDPPWAQNFLRIGEAHKWSTGDGVLVAVIDTGVNVSARVPAEPGGDFVVDGGDGLQDCDAHGTLVAAQIAGRPAPGDGFVGVAPGARILSIRHMSAAFTPDGRPADPNDPNASRTAVSIRAMARAIVHAANMGARVINISETACLKPNEGIDQAMLGAALRYAVVEKDAVVVAAAGNAGSSGEGALGSCTQNSGPSPANPGDAFGWSGVQTIVTPAWFVPLVLSVGALTEGGQPAEFSMQGPWVGVAAPGERTVSLFGDVPVNARPGDQGPVDISGTSFASAFVAGVVALVRAKFPEMTANQVMDRVVRTARHPGVGRDSAQGYGPVDAVAALTWDVPLGPQKPAFPTKPVPPPPPPERPDRGPITLVFAVVGVIAVVGGFGWLIVRAARR